MEIFIMKFIMLLLVSSIFIVGWHNITRCTVVINPDNTNYLDGTPILKYWSYLIEMQKTTHRIYYCDDALRYKHSQLKNVWDDIADRLKVDEFGKCLTYESPLDEATKSRVEAILKCKIHDKDYGNCIFLYLDEPVYYLPQWIQKPLSSCVKCMASVYGSFIWVTLCSMESGMFSWSKAPFVSFILFWIIFCIILYQLNYYFYKKLR